MEPPVIFTFGHSTHSLEFVLELLQTHGVNCVVDVRSTAASRFNPQFNKEPLSHFLKRNGVNYLHFAREFGARHTDPELLDDDGRVDFEKVQRSDDFLSGVERLRRGLEKGYVLGLMCSEAEPFDCHRFVMISVFLEKEGFVVQHILKDKTLKTNAQLELQLLKKYDRKLPRPTIFEPDVSPEMQLAAAYRLRNREIGYEAAAENFTIVQLQSAECLGDCDILNVPDSCLFSVFVNSQK